MESRFNVGIIGVGHHAEQARPVGPRAARNVDDVARARAAAAGRQAHERGEEEEQAEPFAASNGGTHPGSLLHAGGERILALSPSPAPV